MKTKPFDLKYRAQIESGYCKVFTSASEPVEIVKWDCKGKYPILAVIDDGDTHDSCFYDLQGVSMDGNDYLLLAVPDIDREELLEQVSILLSLLADNDFEGIHKKIPDEYFKGTNPVAALAKYLYDAFAKVQIPWFEIEIEKAYKNADEVQFIKATVKGRKILPRFCRYGNVLLKC